MPQAESPGSRLLRTRRGRGAEDEPGHPAGAGVPGDARHTRHAWGPSSRGAVFYALGFHLRVISGEGHPSPATRILVNRCLQVRLMALVFKSFCLSADNRFKSWASS